jgi:hypothetical protein
LPYPPGAAGAAASRRTPPCARSECLEEILQAFFDIADRDDIHQAAARLDRVRQWIAAEAARAAADPVFAVRPNRTRPPRSEIRAQFRANPVA